MTIQQLIELIQQHAPDLGEVQAALLLEQAEQDFVEQTKLLTDTVAFTTAAHTRNYALPDTILEITRVDVNNQPVTKLANDPFHADPSTGDPIVCP